MPKPIKSNEVEMLPDSDETFFEIVSPRAKRNVEMIAAAIG